MNPIAETDMRPTFDRSTPSIANLAGLLLGLLSLGSCTTTSSQGMVPVRLDIIATHPLPPASAAYTQWRNDQLAKLASHVDATQPTLLLGDLNITPWNRHFRKLVKQSGLSDCDAERS